MDWDQSWQVVCPNFFGAMVGGKISMFPNQGARGSNFTSSGLSGMTGGTSGGENHPVSVGKEELVLLCHHKSI